MASADFSASSDSARSRTDGIAEAVPVKGAATVAVVRDGTNGLEVLVLRRRASSKFVGGMHLFPGGAVDPADHELDPSVLHPSIGNPDHFDRRVSARLGLDRGGLAILVAAVRECFEEAGLTLGTIGAPPERADHRRLRQSVDRGDVAFGDACRQMQASLAIGELRYLSRWITPVGAVRRYDTRFFAAVAPPDQHADHDGEEAVALSWCSPSEALARFRNGEMPMLTPTSKTLATLAAAETVQELMQSLGDW